MHTIHTPVRPEAIQSLRVGDRIAIVGDILAGRDAVLPRLAQLGEEELAALGVDLEGAVIFHTAVSGAGIGPTSSNKVEIESSIPPLSVRGVRIHVGKGRLSAGTARALEAAGSLFAIVPPVSALQTQAVTEQEVLAFPEEGMEALYRLRMGQGGLEAIVAIAHGRSIFASQEGP
jgi:fumarate hydratase subunit beta